MVEYTLNIDDIFYSLSDPTRRDIMERLKSAQMTVGEVALPYSMSLAAISKHLKVLERAKLIIKRKEGKKQMVTLAPYALQSADGYLEQYRAMWQSRFDKLEMLLNEEE
jgi:DNA-binding transcriptional ArsR family regulator